MESDRDCLISINSIEAEPKANTKSFIRRPKLKKFKCVYLDLVYNRLLGWEGGSSCVVSGR